MLSQFFLFFLFHFNSRCSTQLFARLYILLSCCFVFLPFSPFCFILFRRRILFHFGLGCFIRWLGFFLWRFCFVLGRYSVEYRWDPSVFIICWLRCAVLFGYMPFMIIEYFPNQWKYFVRIVFRTILPNILWHTDWERYLADSFSTHRNARISEKLIIITITIATNKREERLIRCVSTYLSRNRPNSFVS